MSNSEHAKRQDVTSKTRYDELPEWVTLQEAATFCNLSYWTIYQAVKSGAIPSRRIGKKLIYIPRRYFSEELAQSAVTREVIDRVSFTGVPR